MRDWPFILGWSTTCLPCRLYLSDLLRIVHHKALQSACTHAKCHWTLYPSQYSPCNIELLSSIGWTLDNECTGPWAHDWFRCHQYIQTWRPMLISQKQLWYITITVCHIRMMIRIGSLNITNFIMIHWSDTEWFTSLIAQTSVYVWMRILATLI